MEKLCLNVKWQLPPSRSPGILWRICSSAAIIAVGTTSKLWLDWGSRCKVHNHKVFKDLTEYRPSNQPLITVSNHTSCLDDPLLWGLCSWKQLFCNPRKLRWALAGHDVCFKSEIYALIFVLGKTLPVIRGIGVYQRSMDYVIKELERGDWVHVFPEGKINMTEEFIRLKWGVGRLISECKTLPTVLPMWHVGLDDVLPNKTPYIPQLFKNVTIMIGEPIDFRDQLHKLREAKTTAMETRKQITDRIQDEMMKLKVKCEHLHNQRSMTS